jgi:hypothetical protein
VRAAGVKQCAISAASSFSLTGLLRENEALRAGDTTNLEQAHSLKQSSLGQHHGRWIVPIAAAMRSNAQPHYFRHLADLAEKFVKQKAARV